MNELHHLDKTRMKQTPHMKQAPEIQFIGMERSESLASAARERAAKLDRFHPEIMGCRATVELAHKHRQQGRPVAVRLEIALPGQDLTVSRVEDEDAYVAMREAFDDMKRQLEEKVRRLRGQEKHHEPPLVQAVAADEDGVRYE